MITINVEEASLTHLASCLEQLDRIEAYFNARTYSRDREYFTDIGAWYGATADDVQIIRDAQRLLRIYIADRIGARDLYR